MPNYVMDPISSFTRRTGPITALAAYDDTTSVLVDLRGQNDKIIIVKNSGAGALTFNILASADSFPDPVEWDITHLGDTVVAPGATNVQMFSAYYPTMIIQVKGVGGIATVKVAATGN